MDQITRGDCFVARYVRLIGGRKGSKGRWNRGPDSCITLDTLSMGLPHFWMADIPEYISDLISLHPDLCMHAWGEEAVALMAHPLELSLEISFEHDASQEGDDDDLVTFNDTWWWLHEVFSDEDPDDEKWKGRPYSEIFRPKRGFDRKGTWRKEADFFIAGWYEIARHPRVIEWQVENFLDKPEGALPLMAEYGWSKEFTLAALGRLANSRGVSGARKGVRRVIQKLGTTDEDEVIDYLYNKYYGEGVYTDRYDLIKTQFDSSKGSAPKKVAASDLDYDSVPVARVDGSTPEWYSNKTLSIA